MKLTDRSKHGEDFWLRINQTADGKGYFVAGKEHSSIVRPDGTAGQPGEREAGRGTRWSRGAVGVEQSGFAEYGELRARWGRSTPFVA
ncbi:MAG: hypothetical protein ACO1QR_08650 [Chthoniobacteraceae bacterium]